MQAVKTSFLLLVLSFAVLAAFAQDKAIPMTSAHWEGDPARVEFITHRSVPAARGLDGGAALFAKDVSFTDGTIEFDVEMPNASFVGITFRLSEDHKTSEHFYLRAFWPVSPLSRYTLQYATVVDSMSLWDLTDDYQAAANIHQEGWNHVKLVISGRQLRAYVNDMERPALHVPVLEGMTESGGISLQGGAIFANLVIRPDITEDLPATAGYDPTINDSRYLRDWSVSSPVDFPFGRDLVMVLPSMYGGDVDPDLPDSTTQWTPMHTEHRALLNLSRPFGRPMLGERRLVWVKTTLMSEKAQQRRLDLGFSDEVWIFINGQFLHTEANYYGTPGMKEPRGRATIENTSVMLPLAEGENEVLIGVANYFYGWGLIARLDATDGLTMK